MGRSRDRHERRTARRQLSFNVSPEKMNDDNACSDADCSAVDAEEKLMRHRRSHRQHKHRKSHRAKSTVAPSSEEAKCSHRAKSAVAIHPVFYHDLQRRDSHRDAEYDAQPHIRCCNCNHELAPGSSMLTKCRGRRRRHQTSLEQQKKQQQLSDAENTLDSSVESCGLSQAMRLANCSMLQKPTVIIGSKQPKEATNWQA